MKIDAYSVLVILSVMVVVSYSFNYLAGKIKIPSVLLLIGSGIGLQYAAAYFNFHLPPTKTLLEVLGISGLIFIVLEAALDLSIQRKKLPLIWRAFLSALVLLGLTSGSIALIFIYYYNTTFQLALLHAIPLSVVSSAIAIPSVLNMDETKREFIVYESTFSDILGIILFNYVAIEHRSGSGVILNFGVDLILIFVVSFISTAILVFLLNHSMSRVRFFLTFAILILAYSLAKAMHLPSLILVLCFGLVLNNFASFDHRFVHKFLSLERLSDVTKELKIMTTETAFIIRTFFFILFGFSIKLELFRSTEVLWLGLIIISVAILLRFLFLRFLLKMISVPLMLMAPRGLITILLFYSIPESRRLIDLSEGVLFIVIVLTGLAMTVGLLLNKQSPKEQIEDVI